MIDYKTFLSISGETTRSEQIEIWGVISKDKIENFTVAGYSTAKMWQDRGYSINPTGKFENNLV